MLGIRSLPRGLSPRPSSDEVQVTLGSAFVCAPCLSAFPDGLNGPDGLGAEVKVISGGSEMGSCQVQSLLATLRSEDPACWRGRSKTACAPTVLLHVPCTDLRLPAPVMSGGNASQTDPGHEHGKLTLPTDSELEEYLLQGRAYVPLGDPQFLCRVGR